MVGPVTARPDHRWQTNAESQTQSKLLTAQSPIAGRAQAVKYADVSTVHCKHTANNPINKQRGNKYKQNKRDWTEHKCATSAGNKQKADQKSTKRIKPLPRWKEIPARPLYMSTEHSDKPC